MAKKETPSTTAKSAPKKTLSLGDFSKKVAPKEEKTSDTPVIRVDAKKLNPKVVKEWGQVKATIKTETAREKQLNLDIKLVGIEEYTNYVKKGKRHSSSIYLQVETGEKVMFQAKEAFSGIKEDVARKINEDTGKEFFTFADKNVLNPLLLEDEDKLGQFLKAIQKSGIAEQLDFPLFLTETVVSPIPNILDEVAKADNCEELLQHVKPTYALRS
jgi:hypothetical protein